MLCWIARETRVTILFRYILRNGLVWNTLAILLCSENANPFEEFPLKSSTVVNCPGVPYQSLSDVGSIHI